MVKTIDKIQTLIVKTVKAYHLEIMILERLKTANKLENSHL